AHDPDRSPSKGSPGAYRTIVRIFAATVTATFVLALAGLSLDLVAWQCATLNNPCGASHWYLAFLTHGTFAPTGRRLAVAALLAVVALTIPGMVDRDRPGRWAQGYARGLRYVAVLLTIGVLGYAWRPRPEWATHGGLPGYGMTITVLFAAQIGLLLLLALVAI